MSEQKRPKQLCRKQGGAVARFLMALGSLILVYFWVQKSGFHATAYILIIHFTQSINLRIC